MVGIKLASSAIDALQQGLKGSTAQVILPGDTEYEESIKRWSETSEKRAGAVIKPRTADDVSAIVKISRLNEVPFTVRGGGHSTNGASAAAEDGVVIDLSNMRSVIIDEEALTITAGGGCLWEDVDREAGKYGLATVGGTVNHTGIGGLTLGGGFGWLAGRHGLVVDNLLAVTVVLADGSIVKASQDSHEDLFWAVRGAGHSFGVVTEFVYRAHEQKNSVFAGLMAFTPDKLPKVVDFVNWLHENSGADQGVIWGFGGMKPDMKPLVIAAIFYNGTQEDGERFFAPLLQLGPIVDHTHQMPYCEVNSILNRAAEFGGRNSFSSGNFQLPVGVEEIENIYRDFASFVAGHPGSGESLLLFEVFPNEKILQTPNEAMAFANRGDFYNIITVFKYYDSALDGSVRENSKMLTEKISRDIGVGKGRTQSSKGVGHYGNYLESGEQLGAERVYGANTARLQSIKLKHDPKNLFRKVVNLLPSGH